jgi:hypothetical protein
MLVGLLVVVTLVCTLTTPHPGQAAEFTCPSGDAACPIVVINTANANGEVNTIPLEAGTYTLTGADNTTNGPHGLPSVTSPLTIQGVGADATLLERAASAPAVRLVYVAGSGNLTLARLTLRGGGDATASGKTSGSSIELLGGPDLAQLRISGDGFIILPAQENVSTSAHFIPLPLHLYCRNRF